jgi:hypothetical protein
VFLSFKSVLTKLSFGRIIIASVTNDNTVGMMPGQEKTKQLGGRPVPVALTLAIISEGLPETEPELLL